MDEIERGGEAVDGELGGEVERACGKHAEHPVDGVVVHARDDGRKYQQVGANKHAQRQRQAIGGGEALASQESNAFGDEEDAKGERKQQQCHGDEGDGDERQGAEQGTGDILRCRHEQYDRGGPDAKQHDEGGEPGPQRTAVECHGEREECDANEQWAPCEQGHHCGIGLHGVSL